MVPMKRKLSRKFTFQFVAKEKVGRRVSECGCSSLCAWLSKRALDRAIPHCHDSMTDSSARG